MGDIAPARFRTRQFGDYRGYHMTFENNVGGTERTVRIVVGATLMLLAFIGPKTPLGWLGMIPLATGFLSFCPIYHLLGKSSVPATAGAEQAEAAPAEAAE